MRVTISDTLGEALQAQLRGGIKNTLDAEVEKRLGETLHAPEGRIVLSHKEGDEIAEALGTGLPIRNKVDLARAVMSASQIHLGNVRLVWTPTQLKQIEDRARRIGETADRFVARVAAKVLTDIFLVQPADEGVLYTPGFDPTQEIEDEEGDGTGPPLDATDDPRDR